MSPRRAAWAVALLLAAAGIAVFLAAAPGSPEQQLVYLTVGLGTVVMGLVGVLALPRRARAPWWGVVGYVALAEAGDIVYLAQERSPGGLQFPGLADVLYLLGYLSMFAALALFIRQYSRGHSLGTWIDTAILTIAVVSVVAVFVLVPTVRAGDLRGLPLVVTLMYPLVDILLLAALARLIAGLHRFTPALALVTFGFGVTFIADLVYAGVQITLPDEGLPAWTDALYLVALVALVAAIWTRSAARELSGRVQPVDAPGTGRMLALAVGALTVPVVLIVLTATAGAPGGVALAVGCVLIIALVLWRFQMVLTLVAAQARTLDSLARTDALTGLPNRRTLDHELGRVTAEAALQGRPLTIAMLDLDRFKAFNDSHGHQAGDEALIACAQAWHEGLGGEGFLARYGGEEFAVLLPGLGLGRAAPLLEHLRRATPSPHTVSIGLAERRPGETGFETMSRADRALYRAKDNGRNQVVADGG